MKYQGCNISKAAGTTKLNATTSTRILDPAWKREAFVLRIAKASESYGNSHDMCLWDDIVLALACCVLYALWHNAPGTANANIMFQPGIPGILVHGMIHGLIGNDGRKKYQAQMSSSNKENVFLDDNTSNLLEYGFTFTQTRKLPCSLFLVMDPGNNNSAPSSIMMFPDDYRANRLITYGIGNSC
jgi:hypothetical protein